MKAQPVRIVQRRFSTIIDSILNNTIQNLEIHHAPKVTCKSPTHTLILQPVEQERLSVCFQVEKDDLNSIYKAYKLESKDIECLDATFVDDNGKVNLLFNINYSNAIPLKIFDGANANLIDLFNILLSSSRYIEPVDEQEFRKHILTKICDKDINLEEYFHISETILKRLPQAILDASVWDKLKEHPNLEKSVEVENKTSDFKSDLPNWWETYMICYPGHEPGDEIKEEHQDWAMFIYRLQKVIKSLKSINIETYPSMVGTVLAASKEGEMKTMTEIVIDRIIANEIGIREYTSLYNVFNLTPDTIDNFNYHLHRFTSAFKSKRGLVGYLEEDDVRSRSRGNSLENFRDGQRRGSGDRGSRR